VVAVPAATRDTPQSAIEQVLCAAMLEFYAYLGLGPIPCKPSKLRRMSHGVVQR
jgi:hypothetical protein